MKKQYIEKICNNLNEQGWTDAGTYSGRQAFSTTSGFGKSLRYLPEEHLKQMANTVVGPFGTFPNLYQYWGKQGYFKFKPYIIKNSSNSTTLVLRRDKFLHLFRGYYFQVSQTADGIGSYSHGSIRIDGLLKYLRDCEDYYDSFERDSVFITSLVYSACIEAASGLDCFMSLLRDDSELIDEFIHRSLADEGYHINKGWKDIQELFHVDNDEVLAIDYDKVFELRDSSNVVARFAYKSDTIVLEKRHRTIHFSIPALCVSDADIDVDEAREELLKYDPNYLLRFLLLLLNTNGFVLNYMTWYSTGQCFDINPANAQNAIAVETLSDVEFTVEE